LSKANELKSILENADFDIDTDLTLISKKKQGQDKKYSTSYTLAKEIRGF